MIPGEVARWYTCKERMTCEEAGLAPEQILGTLIAIAPVIGTARVVSAAGSIIKAFALAEVLAEEDA